MIDSVRYTVEPLIIHQPTLSSERKFVQELISDHEIKHGHFTINATKTCN